MPETPCHQPPAALRGVLDWVDDRFGPLRTLSGSRLLPPEPAWWVYTCALARAPVGMWYNAYPAGAAGTSMEPGEALARALGEAVERYSALNAAGAGDGLVLTPRESSLLGRFPTCASEEPCPPAFRSPDPDVLLTHVLVRRLADGHEVAIPAAYVHLNFQPPAAEPALAPPISTGLAFHPELHQAVWAGLCEVAERDALMLMWWNRRPLPALDCAAPDLPTPLLTRLEQLARVGLTAHLFDMTTDFRVPTVFCLLTGERFPYFVTGAACRADPVAACTKAVDEAVSARVSARGLVHLGPVPSLEEFSWVRSLELHELLYAGWRAAPSFGFLLRQTRAPLPFATFAGQPWWPAPVGMAELAALAGRLGAQGLTVLWAEVTAPEATDFGHVVKVIVPEMVPLALDHNARWLATPRLLRAGGLQRPDVSAFNPFPHPFA